MTGLSHNNKINTTYNSIIQYKHYNITQLLITSQSLNIQQGKVKESLLFFLVFLLRLTKPKFNYIWHVKKVLISIGISRSSI